jgi:hypothetical protein
MISGCVPVVRIKTLQAPSIIVPYFTAEHYDILRRACRQQGLKIEYKGSAQSALIRLLKWMRMDESDPLRQVKAQIAESPFEVPDCKARRWKD